MWLRFVCGANWPRSEQPARIFNGVSVGVLMLHARPVTDSSAYGRRVRIQAFGLIKTVRPHRRHSVHDRGRARADHNHQHRHQHHPCNGVKRDETSRAAVMCATYASVGFMSGSVSCLPRVRQVTGSYSWIIIQCGFTSIRPINWWWSIPAAKFTPTVSCFPTHAHAHTHQMFQTPNTLEAFCLHTRSYDRAHLLRERARTCHSRPRHDCAMPACISFTYLASCSRLFYLRAHYL